MLFLPARLRLNILFRYKAFAQLAIANCVDETCTFQRFKWKFMTLDLHCKRWMVNELFDFISFRFFVCLVTYTRWTMHFEWTIDSFSLKLQFSVWNRKLMAHFNTYLQREKKGRKISTLIWIFLIIWQKIYFTIMGALQKNILCTKMTIKRIFHMTIHLIYFFFSAISS